MSRLDETNHDARIRVLLVNRNESYLHVAADFLHRCDELVVVGQVSQTEEALSRAQNLRPRVILWDLDMPGNAGLKAVPLLRHALPDTCIIALTLSMASAYRQAALAAGADDLVSKSALTSDLMPAIRRAVGRRSSQGALDRETAVSSMF